MRRLLYPLVFALVLLLAGSAVTLGGDIPPSGGTVPGEGVQVWFPVVGKAVCPYRAVEVEYQFVYDYTLRGYYHRFIALGLTSRGDIQIAQDKSGDDILYVRTMSPTRGSNDLFAFIPEDGLTKGATYFSRMRYVCDNEAKTGWSQWTYFVAGGRD